MPETSVAEPDSLETKWKRRTSFVEVVNGHADGGDLSFPAAGGKAVDAALAEHGFLRANTWIPVDEDSTYWRNDVYRTAAS